MKTKSLIYSILALFCLLVVSTTHAAVIVKTNNTTALNVAGAWTNNVVPGVADIAMWNNTVSTATAATNALGGNLSWSGIRILDPVAPATITAGSTLTLGVDGIDMSAASQDLTIAPALAYVNGAEAWNVASGRTLTITNTFQKSATVAATVRVSTTGTTKFTAAQGISQAQVLDAQNNPYMTLGLDDWAATDGSGNVIAPTYAAWTASIGATFVGPQDVQASFTQSGNGGGSSIRFASATPYTLNLANNTTYTGRGVLVTSGCGGGTIGQAGAAGFIRPNRSSGGSAYMFNVVQNSPNNFTIDCNIANSSASSTVLVKSGTGNLILNRANGYTSGTIIHAGTLTVNSGASMGAATGGGTVTVNPGSTLAVFNGTRLTNSLITFADGTTNKITISSANGQCELHGNFTNSGSLWLQFNYNNGVPMSTTAAPFLAASNLLVNGAVKVAVQSGSASVGQYPLIKWTNAISAGTFANFSIAALPLRTSGYLSNNAANTSIDLVVTNVNEPLSWNTSSGTWDVNNSGNTPWNDTLAVATYYQETNGLGDAVRLDDTAAGGTVTLNVTATPAAVTVSNNASSYTISGSGVIAGPTGLNKDGIGTLALGTANTFTGGLNLINGTTTFSALANLGAGAINFTGGELEYNGNSDDISVRTVTLGAGGGTIDTVAQTVSYANPIGNSGTGSLTKLGTGTLTLNGTNRYSGNTIVGEGTLALGSATTFITNSPSITVSNLALLDATTPGLVLKGAVSQQLTGMGAVAGTVTAGAGTSISPGSSPGTLSISNLILSGGTLVMDISTNVVDRDQLAVSGALTLTSGTVQLVPSTFLTNGTYKIIQYGTVSGSPGNLLVTGFSQPNQVALLNDNGAGEIDVVVITGRGTNITWQGDGANNYWNEFGELNWTNFNGTAMQYISLDKVTFDDTSLNTTVNITNTLVPGTVTVNAAASYTFADAGAGAGKLSGSAGIIKSGAGTLNVLTLNNNSGPTDIRNGTVQVGNGSASGDLGSGNVTNNGALVFQQTDVRSVPGQISGTGPVTQQGTSTLTLSGNNTYQGTTTISSGILQIGAGGATGSLGTNTVTDNGALQISRTGSLILSNDISGSGRLIVDGSAAVLLGGNYTYQANTYLSNGIAKLAAPEKIPDGVNNAGATGWLILDGSDTFAGTLDLAGFNETINALSGIGGTVNGAITNSGGSTTTTNVLTVLGTAGTTYNGVIRDNAAGNKTALVLLGANELRFNGNNTYVGGTFVGNTAIIGQGPGGAIGAGSITLSNGTALNIHNNGGTGGFVGNNVIIPDNSAATIESTSLGNGYNGVVSGGASATNLIGAVVSFAASGVFQHGPFFGTVVVQPGGELRFSSTSSITEGGTNATFDVKGTLHMRNNGTATLGALFGTGAINNPTTSGTGNWIVGTKNSDSAYEGEFSGANTLTKSGTARLTFDGVTTNLNVYTNLDTFEVTTNGFNLFSKVSYSGATTINDGVLALVVPNQITNSPTITLAAATAILDASQMGYVSNIMDLDGADVFFNTATNSFVVTNSVFTLLAGQRLVGYGVVTGYVASSGMIIPGANGAGVAGTLSFSNTLSLNAGATNFFDLSNDPTGTTKTNDRIAVLGDINVNGDIVVAINALDVALPPGNYTLMRYTGALNTNGVAAGTGLLAPNLALGGAYVTAPGELSLSNAPGQVILVVGPGRNLTWTGDGAANHWDVNNSVTWNDPTPSATVFYQMDSVTFDDSSANNSVILSNTLAPASITVSNSTTTPYILGGSSAITGGASLTKKGTGTLILTNGANSFTGGTVVSNGVLEVGSDSGNNQSDSGLGTGPVSVKTGAELRFGGNGGGLVRHFIQNAITLDGGLMKAQDGGQHLTNSIITVGSAGGTMQTVFATKNLVFDSPVVGTGNLTVSVPATFAGDRVVFNHFGNTISGNITIATNGNLALIGAAGVSNSPSIDVQLGGTLEVFARTDGGLPLLSGQTLKGNGVVRGNVTAASGSTVSPGASIGQLTITNTANLGGTTIMEIDRGASPNSDYLVATNINAAGGTLTVNNLGSAPQVGDVFQLFSKGVSGAFAVTNLPSLATGRGWNNTLSVDGKLTVVATVNTTPPTLTNTLSGGVFTLSWPTDHLGWRLQIQTNSLSTGITPNWLDVPDSGSVTTTNYTVDPANGDVLFRLIYP